MAARSYRQFCALAFALDVVGERWTLLIVRELLAGPRRFTDLLDGLPGISPNLLSERLKRLEQQGLLVRRALPPPAASAVYDLTEFGHGLEPALLALGRWGSRRLPASLDGVAPPSAGAMALAIKAFFRPEQAQNETAVYELHLDCEVLQVRVVDGTIDIRQGQAREADAVFRTSMDVFVGLFAGQIAPDDAMVQGLIQVEGNPAALSRFLALSRVSGEGA